MRFKRYVTIILFGLFMMLMSKNVNATTSATVFTGESIEIDKLESVEITSNDIKIDLDNSKVLNEYLIKNNEDGELITKITAKLEDEQVGFSIKDLSIKVNDLEIKNIEKIKDDYIFYVKIEPNSYKKIEFEYNTENDLKNAKVIKYSLDSFKDKKVKKFNFDVVIPEEDVPLVKKIYPECFEYDEEENDINVNYYDFTVNNLTKDFIIEKETYKNLIYGGEADQDEFYEAVYKNAKDMIINGVDNTFSKYVNVIKNYYDNDEDIAIFDLNKYYSDIMNETMRIGENGEAENSETLDSVLEYILYKQIKRDDINKVKGASIFVYNGNYPLTKELFNKYTFSKLDGNMYAKKICIDYVESEGDKELYMGTRGWTRIVDQSYYKQFSEFDLLRKQNTGESERLINYIYEADKNFAYRTINVGLDISGNKINTTEEEIVDYVNMIGTDLYIRKVIYDGNVIAKRVIDGEEYEIPLERVVAYYNDENKEIASKYTDDNENSKCLKFENEIMANNSKVPTLASCVGYRRTIEGKYVVDYFMGFYTQDSLGNVKKAINTSSAKSLIESNNEENEETKAEIEEEIKTAEIEKDKEEFDINKKDSVMMDTPVEEVVEEVKSKFKLSNIDLIIVSILAGAILINIIIIIKNKRRNKNGK